MAKVDKSANKNGKISYNKDINKKKLLKALESSSGNISLACKSCKMSRQSFYQYCKEDPDFKQAYDNINESTLDNAEDKLQGLINESNITAIIFYLKTKGKHRGYCERTPESNNNEDVKGKFTEFIKAVQENDTK